MHINVNQDKGISDIINNVYELINKIKNIFTRNNDEIIVVNQMDILHKKTESIYQNLKDIFLILGDYQDFEEEFINCGDIKLMAEYIFSNDELILRHIDFINEIILKFCNILKYRLETLDCKDFDYDEKYESFDEFLDNQKDIFYTEIYNEKIDSKSLEVADYIIQTIK